MDIDRKKIIANNIKKYIKEKGINQKTLAEKVGITPSTMSDYINLRSHPSHGVIQRMADYFGVKKSDIDTTWKTTPEPEHTPNIAKIVEVSKKLHAPRQEEVLKYANKQLDEQNTPTNDSELSEELIADNVVTLKQDMVDLDYAEDGAVAGFGNFHEEIKMGKIKIPSSEIPYGTDFGILVDGDSMSPTYPNGSIALVKYTHHLKIGEVGIFKQGSDMWIKEAGQGKLISHNKNYPDITINEGDEPVMVIGKVLGYYVEEY